MIGILEHNEPLDELVQVGDYLEQTLQDAINERIVEILAENGIDEDDVENTYSSITVNITIEYKKKDESNE